MNDLKLFAKCYVEAHDLTNENKKKLFEFIDNVSNVEIINLLETGKMEYLSEPRKQQIIESLQLSEYTPKDTVYDVAKFFWWLSKKVTGKKPFMSIGDIDIWLKHSDLRTVNSMFLKLVGTGGVAVTVIVGITLYLAARYLREKLSKAGQACKGKKGKEFKKCVLKYKIDAYKGQLQLLQKGLATCSKSKNPGKCKAKIYTKIGKTERKIDELTRKLQKY